MKELLPFLVFVAIFTVLWLLLTIMSSVSKRNRPGLSRPEQSTLPDLQPVIAPEIKEEPSQTGTQSQPWFYQSRLNPEQLAEHLKSTTVINDSNRQLNLTWKTVTLSNFSVNIFMRGPMSCQATGQMQQSTEGTLVKVVFPSFFRQIGLYLIIAYLFLNLVFLGASWPVLVLVPHILWIISLGILALMIPYTLICYIELRKIRATFIFMLPKLVHGIGRMGD